MVVLLTLILAGIRLSEKKQERLHLKSLLRIVVNEYYAFMMRTIKIPSMAISSSWTDESTLSVATSIIL